MASFIVLYKGKHFGKIPARNWQAAVDVVKDLAKQEGLDFSKMDVL